MKRAALSASRAKDFKQCPLRFRYLMVDKLPEPPSSAAVRGTLVHAVLERIFDLPAAARDEGAAQELVGPQWDELAQKRPEVHELFAEAGDVDAFLSQARALVSNYFRLENPQRLDPTARERFVEVELGSGVLLRGFVDRIDTAPNGAVRVVDYKTGKAPSPRFTEEALFQMRFYALMLWRLDGVAPARLQLIYLGDGRTLTLDPHTDDLLAFEAELDQLWDRIEDAARREDFRPRKTPLCPWCSFQEFCPEFGGTIPPIPEEGLESLLAARRSSLDRS
ncbi:putative RecB family exonuclease [Ruaniaceae bacterium KH17]|nr:putative RecB family exonuclease [Ruaniaceae bacterium KH17]